MISSVNKKIITKPHTGSQALKTKIKSGFAHVEQKVTIVGLEVLVDAPEEGISKGDVVYLKEEVVSTNPSMNRPMECESISEPFVVIDYGHIIFVGKK